MTVSMKFALRTLIALVAIVVNLAFTTACTEQQKVINGLNIAADAVTAGKPIVAGLNLPPADLAKVNGIFDKLGDIVARARAIAIAIPADATKRQALFVVIDPAIADLQALIANDTIPISDPKARSIIAISLASVKAGLTIAENHLGVTVTVPPS